MSFCVSYDKGQMKPNNNLEATIIMFQDIILALIDTIKDYKRKQQPSLLAYNIDWFTNCTWLEQIYSFKHINDYLDNGKGSYLK